MSVLEERLSAVINLVSPEIKDLEGLNADQLYDLAMEVANDFMDMAYRIPASMWCWHHVMNVITEPKKNGKSLLQYGIENGEKSMDICDSYYHSYFMNEIAEKQYKTEIMTDMYDTFRYMDPWCDDLFENMDNLTELYEIVLFVADHTEHDNSNWDALLAGVPVNDVLAI